MAENLFVDLAARGARFPVGTDLVLREKADHEAILLDGLRLGGVCEEAAERYGCPLALPLMDLTVEKGDLLRRLGFPGEGIDSAHLDHTPSEAVIREVAQGGALSPRLAANVEAVRAVVRGGRKVPCGMAIGPFSLTTKLLASPIEAVYMAGMGMTGEDDPEVAMLEQTLALAEAEILLSLRAQVEAGAQVVFLAEPATNVAYFSPKQMEEGSDAFERLAMAANERIVGWLHERGVQVIFHCCGELIEPMVAAFCRLAPEMLSLGSSRSLAEDARLVPDSIVLYGNLPSKRFYSDSLCPLEEVVESARKLVSDMRQTGHPFILGSECDVLSVPGAEETIREKVAAMLRA